LQPAPNGAALLNALAARTGGHVLSLDDPSAVFSGDSGGGTVRLRFFSRLRGLSWLRGAAT
jgi:hypothetical protein